ncbi:MAG: aldehyde dehydrogenase [Chitinophagaceae bacterium]|nr:aldehyde dehydrogenase [Chitinophagaceae bacterium]MBK7678370.1 aldehyde dehydrogenase [Chitinophagaceae bacterium]MBK8300271.1 aldehyde dehydrogenase [Chitinophagaceae bacterium]MBK9938987.1 aldehyde dehydrogenase [Chitinophagaceae bacterium]MBL0067015.1 aldehyde dehydrogenase [Chitinophagaceae bacterium]
MADISALEKMRQYFNSGATKTYVFRKEQLKKLKTSILNHEESLYTALYTDLKKSREETWVTETGMVISELNAAIKNLRHWMGAESVSTNLLNLPSGSRVMKEPLGVVLIIGPWNYPFQLLINPLIGAIAAGNCVVLKPSEFAPATDAVMKKIIEETFPKEYILYVQGDGAAVIPGMMNNFTFDHVFYTGSTVVGKIIYKMAAERLVPVTLELGGKSPCVVESDANIKVAARRIAMTKFSNAGQMCVAPDYLLVHHSVKDKLLNAFKEVLPKFFGDKPEDSYNYGKIINEKQFNRIAGYLSTGTKIFGGRTDKEKLFIEPTILTDVPLDSAVMNDEIFGPVLPIITFDTMDEAKAIIDRHPNPLSFYIYTSNSIKEKEWLDAVPSGGSCVNNSSWHLTNHNLPFGGRGFSGTGCYHGKYSFDTFSHKKAVMKTPTWFDPSIKYPPFKGKLKLFKWVIR